MSQKGFSPILIVLFVIMVISLVGGAYYLGGQGTASSQKQIINNSQSENSTATATSTLPPNVVEVDKIVRLIEFTGSDNKAKKLIVIEESQFKKAVYITDEQLNLHGAKKIYEDGQSEYPIEVTEDTPSISSIYGPNKKFIVVWLKNGDTSDMLIADEFGEIITNSVKKTNPEFNDKGVGYITFEGWLSYGSLIQVNASGYETSYKARIDITSGKIVGQLSK